MNLNILLECLQETQQGLHSPFYLLLLRLDLGNPKISLEMGSDLIYKVQLYQSYTKV